MEQGGKTHFRTGEVQTGMMKIICDRCKGEVETQSKVYEDNYMRYGHITEDRTQMLNTKTLDLCKDCMIEFERWLKYD